MRSVKRTARGALLTPPAYNGTLTAEEVVFCRAYVEQGGKDPEAAWVEAFGADAAARLDPDELTKRARTLLARPLIVDQLAKQRADACAALSVSPQSLVARLARVALADPREIVQHRRVACRHCWGEGHAYQYTQAEFDRLTASAMAQALEAKAEYRPPDPAGGVGYRRNRAPHPECPECSGEGLEDVYIADTASLSMAGASLYAGVKETKEGRQVLLHDQLKALQLLADLMGMTPDVVRASLARGAEGDTADFEDPAQAADAYKKIMDGA